MRKKNCLLLKLFVQIWSEGTTGTIEVNLSINIKFGHDFVPVFNFGKTGRKLKKKHTQQYRQKHQTGTEQQTLNQLDNQLRQRQDEGLGEGYI